MKLKSPCLECPDRYIGCHSECLKYIDYEQANACMREVRYQQHVKINLVRSFKRDGCEKARRHRGK